MAQAGYTPIQLYYSTTAAAVPTAGNLASGELAINIVDGKLYYKDSGGSVQTLAVSPSMPQVISVNSASDALRITQTGAGNALVVEDDTNPDATPFVVDASGRVILGYTSYDASWFTSGNAPTIWQVANTTNRVGFGSINYSGPGGLSLFRAGGGVIGTEGSVANGDIVGAITFAGYDGTTSNAISTAVIRSEVDGTPGTNDMPGRLVFSTTADGASSPTERMRIDNAGRVGIGATPTSSFCVLQGRQTTGAVTVVNYAINTTVQSDVTNLAVGFRSSITTAAAAFTLANAYHFQAIQPALGATSALTNQFGFLADSTLTGATNNYGFYSNIASGTGRFNFYANGTADNYFGGQVQLNQDYIEKRYTANSGASITLDLANGTMQDITLTGTATITMPTAVAGKSFILLLRSGAGSYGVTWSTVKWPGGTAPTITTTASRLDIYSFFSDGTNWYGITVSQNYTP